VARLVCEDTIIEYLTFFFLLVSSLFFLATFFYSKTGNNVFGWIRIPRNIIFLGLAAVLFFGAGEEISWGQRILDFDTPEALEENEQDEFTIHNLPVFNTVNESNLFSMNHMFLFFWFGFGIFLPLTSLGSKRLQDMYAMLGVPIVPLALGGLFMLNYILSKLYYQLDMVRENYGGRLSEIRESQEGLIFALIALLLLLFNRGVQWVKTEQLVGELTAHAEV